MRIVQCLFGLIMPKCHTWRYFRGVATRRRRREYSACAFAVGKFRGRRTQFSRIVVRIRIQHNAHTEKKTNVCAFRFIDRRRFGGNRECGGVGYELTCC